MKIVEDLHETIKELQNMWHEWIQNKVLKVLQMELYWKLWASFSFIFEANDAVGVPKKGNWKEKFLETFFYNWINIKRRMYLIQSMNVVRYKCNYNGQILKQTKRTVLLFTKWNWYIEMEMLEESDSTRNLL